MYFKLLKFRLAFNVALQNLSFKRQFVTKRKCYYQTLGLSPGATIGEIKSAYYNLSMVYHPDKNDGSEEASEMFRSITEAYDVLSNLNRKKLYDKGLHSSSSDTWKSKVNIKKRSSVPQSGKTPFYDFDSWTQAHYGKTFRRRQFEKSSFNEDNQTKKSIKRTDEQGMTLLVVFVILLSFACILESIYETKLDEPKVSNKER